MPIVKGEAMWASVQAPNTQFTPCWCIDVIITEKQANAIMKESLGTNKKAASAGIKIKKNKEGQYVFKIKRDVAKADGSGENEPPVVRDSHNRDFEGMVGNGSIVNAQYNFFPWNNKFGNGVGADFKGVQVLDLVAYGEVDGEGFEETDGEEAVKTGTDPVGQEAFDEDDF